MELIKNKQNIAAVQKTCTQVWNPLKKRERKRYVKFRKYELREQLNILMI